MEIYVVQSGDTVDKIAESYQIPVTDITVANQMEYPYALAVGQALLIPVPYGNTPNRTIVSGGYAYPFINPEVLAATLPYLTEISVFSYGFTIEGELTPPLTDDSFIIDAALRQGVKPILTLTPMGADGTFNNSLISELVNSEQRKNTLIDNLLIKMQQKGYQGADIDFEYIKAEDRDAFTLFVEQVTQRLNNNGYQVLVDLAPKTSSSQQGLLYQGKDYPAVGAAANHVLLMTYEWGYTYSEPMAVAPVNKVRQVLEYAITEIPREKIRMGIPNYGYDWTLPYEKGVTKAKTIGNVEAVQLAVKFGAVIQYDETAQTPYFTYSNQGIMHEVWFEDIRSINAKFDLCNEFLLDGFGYWQLMRLFTANWLLMENRFYIE